jgi:2-methylaconitate cis-trans-isomerase PrpF
MVSEPADYRVDLTGRMVTAAEVDLVSRLMFMQQMHKTYAGTSTVCTGVASRLPGTIVNDVTRATNRTEVRIGHPAGVIETETTFDLTAEAPVVRRATLGRTARRLMEGYAFVPEEAARNVSDVRPK